MAPGMDLVFKLNPVSLIFLIPGLITAALALYTFSIRNAAGSRVFSLVMLGVSFWSLSYAAELAARDLTSILFVAKIEYFGIATVPVLWLVLSLVYTGHDKWLRPRYLIYLFAVPAVTIIMVATNQAHHLYYSSVSLNLDGPFPQLSFSRGIWYWVNSGYSYLAILGSCGLLLEKLRHPNPAYRPQIIAMLIGVSIPWLANILYVAFRITVFGNIDLTPLAFALSGLVIVWGMFRYRLFSVVPAAREYIIASMQEGVIVVDFENKVVDINQTAQQILNWDKAALGRPIVSLLADWPEMQKQLQSSNNSRQEIARRLSNQQNHYEVTVSNILEGKGRTLGRLIIIRDISDWKNQTQKLRQLATHDPLTGLPGRLLLTDRIEMAISRAKRNNHRLAVIMCDMDHFKTINDTLGHNVGDSVLKAVSLRLREPLRHNDTIARLGGDEFVILLPEISHVEQATAAANRLLLSFHDMVNTHGYHLQLSFSLGIAVYPEDGESYAELLKHADEAMYQAKKNGRNTFELYSQPEKSASSTQTN
jgi:diguanylate cyclase (GGDEF)-like protein/PAS domain S-box-containing protein